MLAAKNGSEAWLLDKALSTLWQFRQSSWNGPWQLEEHIETIAAGATHLWVSTPGHPEKAFAKIGPKGSIEKRFGTKDPTAATPAYWLFAGSADGTLLAVDALTFRARRYDSNGGLLWEKILDGPLPKTNSVNPASQTELHLQPFDAGFLIYAGGKPTIERYDPDGYWLESLEVPPEARRINDTRHGRWTTKTHTFGAGQWGLWFAELPPRPPRGRILASDNAPIHLASVSVQATAGATATTNTDARGSFELNGLRLNDQADLHILAAGYLQHKVSGVLEEALSRVIRLEAAPMQCIWVFDGSLGTPIDRYRLSISRAVSDQGTTLSTAMSFDIADPEGRGCLAPPWPLPWMIRAEATGFAPREVHLAEAVDLEIDLTPAATLMATVEDPEGKALASAVLVADPADSPPIEEDPALRSDRVLSDAEGIALLGSLEPGTYRVRIWHPAFPTWETELDVVPGQNPLHAKLAPGATLEARVQDPLGAPIPGAQVHLEALAHEGSGKPRCETSEDGHCTLSGLAPGSYRVHARRESYSPAFEFTTITEQGDTATVAIQLQESVRLHGFLSGTEAYSETHFRATAIAPGVPVEHADIDQNGEFSFPGLPTGPLRLSIVDGGGGGYLRQRVVIPEGVSEHRVDLELPWPVQVEGQVRRGHGPCDRCRLEFLEVGGHDQPARKVSLTAADGFFSLLLASPGIYRIGITAPSKEETVHFEREILEGVRQDFDLGGASLQGRAVFADGQPAERANIQVRSLPSASNGSRVQTTKTGSLGRFHLEGLQPGSHVLTATHGKTVAKTTVDLPPSGLRDLELILQEGTTLRLRLLNADTGLPVEEASFLQLDQHGTRDLFSRLRSDATGIHQLTLSENSPIDLVIEANGFAREVLRNVSPSSRTIDVPLSPAYRSLIVEVAPGVGEPCTFELLDAAGLPVSLGPNLAPGPVPLRLTSVTFTKLQNGSYVATLKLCDGNQLSRSVILAPGPPALLRFAD